MAADVVAQMTKAVERFMLGRDWIRAQHLELIPAEGSALIKKDEAWMLAKEAEVTSAFEAKEEDKG